MTTPAQFVADHDYTDEGLLKLLRQCYAAITVMGQSYQIGDRVFTNADIKEVRIGIADFEAKIAAASGSNPSQILARFPGR